MNQEYKGKLAVLVAAIIWGFLGIALKKLYGIGISVPTVMFAMVIFTPLIMLLFWKKIEFKPKWKDFKLIIWMAVFGNATGFSLLYAFKFSKIGLVEFLHYTMPAWAFIMAIFLLREKIGKWRFLALMLSIVGVGLVFNVKMLFNGLDIVNIGNILALLSAFTYAAQINVLRKMKLNQYTVCFWDYLISIPVVAPFFYFSNTITSISQVGVLFVYVGVFTVIAMLLYIYGTRRIEVTKSSIILLFEVIIAVIAAWIFLKEALTITNIIGGLLILISAVILIIKKK